MSYLPTNPAPPSQLMDIAWTAITAPGTVQWKKVVYAGNGIFIAVGTNAIMRSSDYGKTWGAVTSPANKTWNAIATNGQGVLVALAHGGTGNIGMRSTDYGLTWSQPTTITSTILFNDIVYNPISGKFVAVGEPGPSDNNNVMISSDVGLTWSYAIAGSPVDRNYLKGICFNRGIYVACGTSDTNSVVWTSPDATTWTHRLTPGDTAPSFNAVTWNSTGGFVLVGDFGDPFAGTLSSWDGITWTISAPGYETLRTGIVASSSLYVAVSVDGLDSQCLVTNNGRDWHFINTPEDNGWSSIAASENGVLVAVATSGTHRIMRAKLALTSLSSASLNVFQTAITGPTAIQPLVDQHLNAPLLADLLYTVDIAIDFTAAAPDGIKVSFDNSNLSPPSYMSCYVLIIDSPTKVIAASSLLTDLTTFVGVTGPTAGHIEIKGLIKVAADGVLAPTIKSNSGGTSTTIQGAFMRVFPITG
jgi:hypothetical protein